MQLLEIDSPQQRIELYDEHGSGLVLVLDGMVQYREAEEQRYHECLTVVPMLFGSPRHVFIGGGGDGLAAARLLRFEEIESVVVCDYDALLTELHRTHPDLSRLNRGALSDPRVRTVNADAFAYLRESTEVFDLVICDFPDAFYLPLGRLYSRAFYEQARARLAEGGLLVTQTLAVPECARMIQATLEVVFGHRRFYKHGPHGFTLAAARPFERTRKVPAWTRFLTDAYADALFVLSKEEQAAFDPSNAAVVEEGDARLVKEAILAVHGQRVAYPFGDRPGAWLAEVGPGLFARLEERAPLLLEALADNAEVVALVDQALGETERVAVAACGFGPANAVLEQAVGSMTPVLAERAAALLARAEAHGLTRLEPLVAGPLEHADVVGLLADAQPPAALVAVGASLEPTQRALLLVGRSSEGAPLAVWRVGDALDGAALECLALVGPELRAPSLLLCLLYLARLEYVAFTLIEPTDDDRSLLDRLGPYSVRRFDVWRHEPAEA